MNQLREKYEKEIQKELQKELKYDNPLRVPRVEKIVVNVGMGEALTNKQALEKMAEDIATITGQKPIVRKSNVAISNFKIRPGDEIGLKVTLRRERMWDFLEKLIAIVLPRVKDFRGVSRKSFDGRGNYSLGIREHNVFPEIDPNKLDKIRSLEVTIVTSANEDSEGLLLLEKLGMPFAKEGEAKSLERMEESLEKEKEEQAKIKSQQREEAANTVEQEKETSE